MNKGQKNIYKTINHIRSYPGSNRGLGKRSFFAEHDSDIIKIPRADHYTIQPFECVIEQILSYLGIWPGNFCCYFWPLFGGMQFFATSEGVFIFSREGKLAQTSEGASFAGKWT